MVDAAIEDHVDTPYTPAEYLTRAEEIADEAIDYYLEDGIGSPLPRMLDKNSPVQLVDGSSYPAYYHGYTGGARLMLELLRLHVAMNPNAPPACDSDPLAKDDAKEN